MPKTFFTGLSTSNFKKKSAVVEVYLVENPNFSSKKLYVPVAGSEALTPAIYDNTTLQYVLFGEKIVLLKKFNFAPSLVIDGMEYMFPFPKDYILKKLSKNEKETLGDPISFDFFQTVVR